jgi:hypothetical protein
LHGFETVATGRAQVVVRWHMASFMSRNHAS